MTRYAVTVTVTHEAIISAKSKEDAQDQAIALSGAFPFDQTAVDVQVERAVPLAAPVETAEGN